MVVALRFKEWNFDGVQPQGSILRVRPVLLIWSLLIRFWLAACRFPRSGFGKLRIVLEEWPIDSNKPALHNNCDDASTSPIRLKCESV